MDTSLLLAEKVAAAAAIGLLIGLEREWAHKETGVRSFAIATLLGTLAWIASPALGFIEVSAVLVVIILVNLYSLTQDQPLQITTSLALAATNVLGILVGAGFFFLAFGCAIVIAALLSWKTELISFTSKLTVPEIRGALLLAFIAVVVYPLLPDQNVGPLNIVNPHAIWLTVIIVCALNFFNYILLRLMGPKGIPYSALLGGLVNSAAISHFLAEELKRDKGASASRAPTNLILADLAMILRNAVLVIFFSWASELQAAVATALVLGPMILVAGIVVLIAWLRLHMGSEDTASQPQSPQKPPLISPLDLRYVLTFALLFFLLTVFSGVGQHFFGSVGFIVVAIVGALVSATSSSILIGNHASMHLLAPAPVALVIFAATLMGLVENVTIFLVVSRQRQIALRMALLTLPLIGVGIAALMLLTFFGQ
ncbi:MAG TPA: DUF4010 domain-containing protein [Ktedonobacteraceae bacterium]|jgi:uncharacterized membrane protein (DUF4010 family)|nr:DUF4010 domain-containing protein [Ktedonobacteraceae bacterium]